MAAVSVEHAQALLCTLIAFIIATKQRARVLQSDTSQRPEPPCLMHVPHQYAIAQPSIDDALPFACCICELHHTNILLRRA